ncbi:MAG TPA: hypothetical protein VFY84_00945 [Jiangellales bacterium]|nr:hypothetical protein [Jiangellales bacterium]
MIEAERPSPTVIAGVLGAAALVGFVAGGVFGSLSFGPAADASPADRTGGPTATAPVALTVTDASCQREPRRDAAGNEVDYRPEYAVDDDTQTGWQCQGDGAGETLDLDLGGTARVTQVGLIPGYAKVDPHDRRDWYPLFRRLTEVIWHFDAGDPVSQRLDPDPRLRDLQMLELPEPRETRTLRLEVISSAGGDTADRRVIAVSDIEVLAAQ